MSPTRLDWARLANTYSNVLTYDTSPLCSSDLGKLKNGLDDSFFCLAMANDRFGPNFLFSDFKRPAEAIDFSSNNHDPLVATSDNDNQPLSGADSPDCDDGECYIIK